MILEKKKKSTKHIRFACGHNFYVLATDNKKTYWWGRDNFLGTSKPSPQISYTQELQKLTALSGKRIGNSLQSISKNVKTCECIENYDTNIVKSIYLKF